MRGNKRLQAERGETWGDKKKNGQEEELAMDEFFIDFFFSHSIRISQAPTEQ